MRKLLTADRAKRLGNLKNGGDDVRKHKWFRGLDFTQLFQRQLESPFVPEVKNDSDTSQFEAYPDSIAEMQPDPVEESLDKELFASF